MKGKLILHIGAPKTGTTSLQSYLRKSTKQCRKQSINPLFLHSDSSRELAEAFGTLKLTHFHKRNKLISPVANRDYFNEFMRQIVWRLYYSSYRYRTTVISSEHIFLRLTDKSNIENLLQFLQRFFNNIEVVFYRRPVEQLHKSLYWEYLKTGGTLEFSEFCCQEIPLEYDPDWVSKTWRRCVGENRFKEYDYSEVSDSVSHFCDEVLSISYIKPTESNPAKRQNSSPKFEEFEKLRQFNLETPEFDDSYNHLKENRKKRMAFANSL